MALTQDKPKQKLKLINIGLAPHDGIITIGISPHGFIFIGAIPHGVISIGLVPIGLLSISSVQPHEHQQNLSELKIDSEMEHEGHMSH